MFGSSLRLFRVFGFEVKVNLSWAFIALLIAWSLAAGYFPSVHEGLPVATYWAMAVLAVFGVFASILVHELAHSLVARRFGIPMRGITLHLFGGAAEMEAEPPTPRAEFWMTIAGPATSLVVGLALIALGNAGDPARPAAIVTRYVGSLNIVLAVFNLLPAFPLDGGRLLRAGIWAATGDFARATRIASTAGSVLGLGVAGIGVVQVLLGSVGAGLWWILIGFFIRSAAMTARLDVEARTMLAGAPVSRFMTTDLVTVPHGMSLDRFVEERVYTHRHDVYPVVDPAGRPLGFVAPGDLRAAPREEWSARPVSSIMTPVDAGSFIGPNENAVAALDRMRATGRTRLMVVDGGRLIGLLCLKDLLERLMLRIELEGNAAPRTGARA